MNVIWPPDDEIPRLTSADVAGKSAAELPAALYLDGVKVMNFAKFDPTPRNYSWRYAAWESVVKTFESMHKAELIDFIAWMKVVGKVPVGSLMQRYVARRAQGEDCGLPDGGGGVEEPADEPVKIDAGGNASHD